jgi:RND family efflux transporter MFP subunit
MKSKPVSLLIGLAILAAAGFGSWWLLRSAPVQETVEKPRSAKTVQTISPVPEDHTIAVTAHGTVIPARRVIVRPEITGRIVSHHRSLVPGGRIAEGETLFTIDDADYRIALTEAETTLAEARSEADVEDGRQVVAKRELEQLRKDLPSAEINEALVLREPFKVRAGALLDRATAAVSSAELNLSRTKVAAPFNAVVIEEAVEVGQLADSGTPLATLVGSDACWIQVSVPLSDLKHIQLPSADLPGAEVSIELSGSSSSWKGKVVRLLGDLEESGRLARILVEVPRPFESESNSPLLLGSYVRVSIDAGTLEKVLEIPRAALREGNRIWIAASDGTLAIRDVEILWRREGSVLIPGVIGDDETLIVSDITAPLPGMAIAAEPLKTEASQ